MFIILISHYINMKDERKKIFQTFIKNMKEFKFEMIERKFSRRKISNQ